MKMRKKLRSKIVLITGGATGIGRAIAFEFAKRNSIVIINYCKSKESAEYTVNKIKKMGHKALKIKADITSEDQVTMLFKEVYRKFKHLDLLVNNAGWTKFTEPKRIERITDGIYQKIVNVNFKGTFLCSREAIKIMKKQKKGDIINISSTSGINGIGSNIIYCAAKAAVINLTKSLAREFGPKIRVNCIAPGFTKTLFIKDIPQRILNSERKRMPLGRMTLPRDIAETVVSLYESIKFVTGETIVVDGKNFYSVLEFKKYFSSMR